MIIVGETNDDACAGQIEAPTPDWLAQLRASSILALARYLPNAVSLRTAHPKRLRTQRNLCRRSLSRFPCSTIFRTSSERPARTHEVHNIPTWHAGAPMSF